MKQMTSYGTWVMIWDKLRSRSKDSESSLCVALLHFRSKSLGAIWGQWGGSLEIILSNLNAEPARSR